MTMQIMHECIMCIAPCMTGVPSEKSIHVLPNHPEANKYCKHSDYVSGPGHMIDGFHFKWHTNGTAHGNLSLITMSSCHAGEFKIDFLL